MTDFNTAERARPVSFFDSPGLPAAAFSGVRTRRMMAFCFDFVLVSILATLLYWGLVVGTLGLAILLLPSLWPFVAFFYNGLTVSGRRMATPGMRMVDLEMRATDGTPVTFLMAGVHGVLLYLSWLFPPVFLASFVLPEKRCLHDMFAGIIVVRRP